MHAIGIFLCFSLPAILPIIFFIKMRLRNPGLSAQLTDLILKSNDNIFSKFKKKEICGTETVTPLF